ncbi:MAG: MotA/TolQ/ExbB proton channel family protein [Candidatus Omnitrophica bacterium]|nr:MotA/TolQ/ExbB proton channel family protein [Candidatus Omnitrophota bacterium]MDD5671795.1 MotA/TolQ/ExbB proton channel family protein [Candidatus Omnitrophota bacterium]
MMDRKRKMSKQLKKIGTCLFSFGIVAFLFLSKVSAVFAAEGTAVQAYAKAVDQTEKGMSLWWIIKSGGSLMIVLALLSMAMVTLTVYLFMRIRIERLVPLDFAHDAIEKIRKKEDAPLRSQCLKQDNMISPVVMAGLGRIEKGLAPMEDIIGSAVKKQMASLWTPLGYLSDIVTVAPMVGLLGTVVGMIQAFNTIAFQTAVVKPILLAGGVSKAMITTAAGLMIAIPAMAFYSYFRPKITEVTSRLELVATEIVEAFLKRGASQGDGGRYD